MSRQRLHRVLRQVVQTAAIVSLFFGSLVPPDCCRVAQQVAAADISTELPCCKRPEPTVQQYCCGGCCESLDADTGTHLPAPLPCNCHLQPRDSNAYLTASPLPVTPENAAPVSLTNGFDLIGQRHQPVAFPSGTGPPERPVRVLYGVWRN